MRLDVFLKTCRLIKRRPVAKQFCDEGRVLVGGRKTKPGREVAPGDVITVKLARRTVTVEVLETPSGNVPKARAAELYRVLKDEPAREDDIFG